MTWQSLRHPRDLPKGTCLTKDLPRRRLGAARGAVRWAIVGALTLVVLLVLGIDLHGLWSTVVAGLSLVAIGSVARWSILSHMLDSIPIIVFRPFELGDRVELVGAFSGFNPVSTTLRNEDDGTLLV